MGDVNYCIGRQLESGWRHNERPPRAAKDVDNGDDVFPSLPADLADFLQARRAAIYAMVRAALGKRFEHCLSDQTPRLIREIAERLVGVERKGFRHSANTLVVFDVQC